MPQTECNDFTIGISFTGKKVKVQVRIIHMNCSISFSLWPKVLHTSAYFTPVLKTVGVLKNFNADGYEF